MTMEDSHVSKFNIHPNVHVFAVFDGHGGASVALYCGDNFVDILTSTEEFKNKNYAAALTKTML